MSLLFCINLAFHMIFHTHKNVMAHVAEIPLQRVQEEKYHK